MTMKAVAVFLGLAALVLAPMAPAAPAKPAAQLAGRWVVTVDRFGTPTYATLTLRQSGDTLTGTYGTLPVEGAVSGETYHFVAKAPGGVTATADGALAKGGGLAGAVVFVDPDDKDHPARFAMTAVRATERAAGPPRRHEFTPTAFHRFFSAMEKPVLSIAPGDTLHTTTVDAGGTDEAGKARSLGGNPQTGPFFVETAMPGDTLVVHIVRLRLNRDWAISTNAFVPRALDPGL